MTMDRKFVRDAVRVVVDTNVVADMTVRDIERIDYAVTKAGGSEAAGIDRSVAIAAMYVWRQIGKYRFTDAGTRLSVRQFNDIAQDVRVRFIQQHIINYAAFSVAVEFYDWLCDRRMINKAAEGCWRKVQRCFDDYQRVHRTFIDRPTWSTFQDHMRLAFDTIRDEVSALETTVRDYLIQHRREIIDEGQKDDIALLQKAAVCFIFLTAMRHSFMDFFSDVIRTHGIDFSAEFRYANLGGMIRNTVWMCEKVGVRFGKDGDGDTTLVGVNINNSVRVTSQWNRIVAILGDDRLLDESASKAISLNKDMLKEFSSAMSEAIAEADREKEERERRDMERGLLQLRDKYNVRSASL